MASLYNEVRLEMDVSQAPNSPMIGVKLDKSKAFDRVIPNVVGALLLAFGAPKHFVNFSSRYTKDCIVTLHTGDGSSR